MEVKVTSKEYYDFREEENTRQVSLLSLLKGALKRWKIILLAILQDLFDPFQKRGDDRGL